MVKRWEGEVRFGMCLFVDIIECMLYIVLCQLDSV